MIWPSALTIPPDDRHTARIAIYAAFRLYRVDGIALRDLRALLDRAADRGHIPHVTDNSQLVRIMQRLGWRKDGYAGEDAARSPFYRRVASARKAA
jgi:GNAT superfamily N-acetyltransferase